MKIDSVQATALQQSTLPQERQISEESTSQPKCQILEEDQAFPDEQELEDDINDDSEESDYEKEKKQ